MWWKALLGTAVVVLAVREMFQDLFHPAQSGALSDKLAKNLFRLFRHWPSKLSAAGPLAVVLSLLLWAGMLIVGPALIYWSVFPQAFLLKTPTQPTGSDDLLWCLYYSMEMLTTLGLGDIQPNTAGLRLLSATHTLIGFSLVTASLTWVILLFPALGRTRTLARKTHVLIAAEQKTGVSIAGSGFSSVLSVVADEVVRARVDLIHFPILLYFDTIEANASLASAVLQLCELAKSGKQPGCDPQVRLAAQALEDALDELARKLAERLNVKGTTRDIFNAFADFHLKLPSG